MTLATAIERAKLLEVIVVILATIGAGGWAVYQYGTTQAPTKAQAEIEKLHSENLALIRQLKGDANLSIKVTANQFCVTPGSSLTVDAQVSISNLGTRSALLDLSDPKRSGLFAISLDIGSDGSVLFAGVHQPQLYTFDPATPGKPAKIGVLDVQPNVTSTIRYLIPVDKPGVYLISFSAPMSKTDVEVANRRLKEEAIDYISSASARWHARDYFLVKADFCK